MGCANSAMITPYALQFDDIYPHSFRLYVLFLSIICAFITEFWLVLSVSHLLANGQRPRSINWISLNRS